jgi:hypothetical protein
MKPGMEWLMERWLKKVYTFTAMKAQMYMGSFTMAMGILP